MIAPQFDLVAGHPAYIQQVLQQQGHLRHLALDHVATPRKLWIRHGALAQDPDRVANRRQRVAQFVCEGGDEVVLAAVRNFQRLFARVQLLRCS